ncbi:MAG: hypothetical protein QXL67_01470 [Candidatus Bathyarchaeia archaeon]
MEALGYLLDVEDRSLREKVKVGIIDFSIEGLHLVHRLSDEGFQIAILDINDSFKYLTNYLLHDKTVENSIKDLKRKIREGKILVSSNPTSLKDSIFFFIFTNVQTDEKGKAEYQLLERSCQTVGDLITKNSVVIISTRIFPGTTERVLREKLENRSGMKASVDFGLAYVAIPLGGRPVIVGALDEYSLNAVAKLFEALLNGEVIKTKSIKIAEATSFLEDAYYSINLAFSNEVAELCERMNLDFFEVTTFLRKVGLSNIVNPHPIEKTFLSTHRMFIDEAGNLNVKLRMLKLSTEINESMMKRVFNLIKNGLKSSNKTVRRSKALIIGVPLSIHSTSPRTSITKSLYDLLGKGGMQVEVFTSNPLFEGVEDLGFKVQDNLEKSLKGKDCLIFMSKEKVLSDLSLRQMKHLVNQPALIVDLANEVDKEEALREGFLYINLGRGLQSRWISYE